MDFWLVWEYAVILLLVLSELKDPLLCTSSSLALLVAAAELARVATAGAARR